jgi:protein phosphatase
MPDDALFNLSVYAKTDVGLVRSGNEDGFLVVNLSTADTWTSETLPDDPVDKLTEFGQGYYGAVLAVTDGMGGALAGEVASRMAVESVRDRLLELQVSPAYSKFPFHERLRLAIELANLYIHHESLAHSEYAGMGATFTAAGIFGTTAYFGQIGDSRAYLIRNGEVRQITRDQSLVEQLIESGHITAEEAERHTYKNVILQALGAAPYINVAVSGVELCDGDTIILCSDGLSNKVRGDEMGEIVEHAASLKDACESLVYLANERGGEDNITTLVVRINGGKLPQASDPNAADEVDPWHVEAIQRDPSLPHEIDPTLVGDEEETFQENT